MDRRLTLPVFGNAPKEYDSSFLDDISRKLNQLITALRSPGEGRQSRFVITELTESDYGLEPGTLFQVNGAVYVAVAYKAYIPGLVATSSIGSVTVTTV